MGKIIPSFLLLYQIFFSSSAFSLNPITPEDALTKEEISHIIKENNYFFYKQMDSKTPIWMGTKRKYGEHFLKKRSTFFTLEQVIESVLTKGFPMKYRMQELYQGKLGVHSRLGKILPKLDINFGEGVSGLDIGKVFSGLFGFLLPSNWMKLANQRYLYTVSKLKLERTALDEILKAKLLYINQHQRIQEFEILNYYFIHLQLFAREHSDNSRAINTLLGRFAFQGTEMASKRGDTKLGYDDLTLLMGLEKIERDHTLKTFNIADIKNFPHHVPDLDEKVKVVEIDGGEKEVPSLYLLPKEYRKMKNFLEQVVRRSIELKIVKKLYKISRLNIGVEAMGNLVDYVDRPSNTDNDARFSFSFGYDTLPDILISRSRAKVNKIRVQEEFIKMLTAARRSFHYYTNALGGYTEAKRSLKLNRKAFKQNVEAVIFKSLVPDGLFFRSMDQLIKSELKLNNALHGSLRARAYMDRFLLVDEENALRHLPGKGELLQYFNDVISKNKTLVKKKQRLYEVISRTNRTSKLRTFLYRTNQIKGLEDCTKEEIHEAISKCVDHLLKSKAFFYKSKRFYKTLATYFKKENIELTEEQRKLLEEKIGSFKERAFRHNPPRDDFYHNFDFENFTTGEES